MHQGKSQAMPGAVEFLNEVHKQGVEIFYVSNRYAPVNYDATVQNFKELGFPSVDKDHVLLLYGTKYLLVSQIDESNIHFVDCYGQ